MAIELDTTRIASQTTAATTQNDAPVMQEAKLTPVLGGENVKVTSGTMSDLEKLVARLKAETDDTKMSLAQQRISILATVLDSMADRISESERNSLLEIEKLNLQKSEAESKLAGYMSEKTAAEGRITALDLQISALEKAIERAVQGGVDHREQVAKLKAQGGQAEGAARRGAGEARPDQRRHLVRERQDFRDRRQDRGMLPVDRQDHPERGRECAALRGEREDLFAAIRG